MFKLITTREEKKSNVLYWDHMRKLAEQIRDEYDKPREDRYNRQFTYSFFEVYLHFRPDFMEPYTKTTRIKYCYKVSA